MRNNAEIDNTSYYRLPCGKYLEDYIADKGFSFALGSAVKYAWRAGKKDGESNEKDQAKMRHYAKFLDRRLGMDPGFWEHKVWFFVSEAMSWKG